MLNALLGVKKHMTATYDSRGRRVGATILEIQPNFVTQVKTAGGQDGYSAVQLGYGTKKSVKKPQIGHAKKAGIDTKIRWFREVRIKNQESSIERLKLGQEINLAQVFSLGDAVKITGTSKGKGFAGVVKRWGFVGGPKTHGQSDRLRAPGSIGAGTTPGRVYKGKKMAGHMGNVTVSVRGLEVVGVDKEKNLLVLKGAVPGPTGGLVMVTRSGRIKGYTPPPEEKEEEESSFAEAPEGKEELQNSSENSENQQASESENLERVNENATS